MDISVFTNDDFKVKSLGNRRVKSPLILSKVEGDGVYNYVEDGDRILYNPSIKSIKKYTEQGILPISFEKAGPKEFIYFDPSKTKVGIVTCGGLCPGLNNVIRGLVMQLYYRYNVTRILGFQYGYEGFIAKYNHPFIELTPHLVANIHSIGGSILGSSRGHQDIGEMVDAMEINNINILFTIGGDGTQSGAHVIHEEIERRGLKISMVGIPKTIDNDTNFVNKTFGFETAFTIANDIVRNAHNEAKGAYNGIAIIKLMGRDSGFIAANTALATQEANFVLVPEMNFNLLGENGFLNTLKNRLEKSHHALIIVGEGAGQFLFDDSKTETDASGNMKFKDIGLYLKDVISKEFKKQNFPHTIKYLDPSYIIRSAPANANDSKFCNLLAQNAVHAGMAGFTDVLIGHWSENFTMLPIPAAVKERKKINLESELWWNVLETTGQPTKMMGE
jgi:6-phosphofructokinase 1